MAPSAVDAPATNGAADWLTQAAAAEWLLATAVVAPPIVAPPVADPPDAPAAASAAAWSASPLAALPAASSREFTAASASWAAQIASDPSTSCGSPNRGALHGAAVLPLAGEAFVVPGAWAARNRRYATRELIGLLQRAAVSVQAKHPGAILGIADLSAPEGGRISGHRSHQSGRDADLLYYAVNEAGLPMAPDNHMPVYTASLRARYARAPAWEPHITARTFDLQRNWAFIRALLTDPQVEVERVFVGSRIKHWLLQYARELGEDEALLARAGHVLQRPSRAQGHDDHMHLRIACSDEDAASGRCHDTSVRRRGRWLLPCPADYAAHNDRTPRR